MATGRSGEILFLKLGLLTPLEIARMTKSSTGVRKVALTDIMIHGEEVLKEDYEEQQEKAKVIAIEDHQSEKNENLNEDFSGSERGKSTASIVIAQIIKLRKTKNKIREKSCDPSYNETKKSEYKSKNKFQGPNGDLLNKKAS